MCIDIGATPAATHARGRAAGICGTIRQLNRAHGAILGNPPVEGSLISWIIPSVMYMLT